MAQVDLDPALDTSLRVKIKPIYNTTRLDPVGGISLVTPELASTYITDFEIPSGYINYAESFLKFQMNFALTTSYPNFVSANPLSFFQNIQLMSKMNNNIIAEVPECSVFANAVIPTCLPLSEIQNSSLGEDRTISAASSNFPVSTYQKTNTTPGSNFDSVGDNSNAPLANQAYGEIQRFLIGASGTATSVTYILKMGNIMDTLFCMNKVLYFPEAMLLRFTWNPISRAAYVSGAGVTGSTTPMGTNTGGTWTSASAATITTVFPIAKPTAGFCSKFKFYLTTDKNPKTRNALKQAVDSGFEMLIPSVILHKSAGQTSGNDIIQRTLQPNAGSSLLKLAYVNTIGIETVTAASSFNRVLNFTDGFMSDYQILINSEPICPIRFNILNGDHWDYMLRDIYKGSCIQSMSAFKQHFCHVESFIGDINNCDYNAVQGLKIERDTNFTVDVSRDNIVSFGSGSTPIEPTTVLANVAAATFGGTTMTTTNYLFFTVHRTLRITNEGVSVVVSQM